MQQTSTEMFKHRLDWVIHWDLCKKFKFDHTNKWYMRNLASLLGIETQKHLWDFEIQTDKFIPARRPGVEINNKK